MNITREEIIEKVKSGNKEWFYGLSCHCPDEYKGEFKIVYDQHYGDGNDYFITLHFTNFNYYVKLDGTYSSWGDPEFHTVTFAQPYEYFETRYKAVTLDYIRDQKIEEIFKKD